MSDHQSNAHEAPRAAPAPSHQRIVIRPDDHYEDLSRRAGLTTGEPGTPVAWPAGHVGAELTGPGESECLRVRVHGVDHMLHATTAVELFRELGRVLGEWEQQAGEQLRGKAVAHEQAATLAAAAKAGRAAARIPVQRPR